MTARPRFTKSQMTQKMGARGGLLAPGRPVLGSDKSFDLGQAHKVVNILPPQRLGPSGIRWVCSVCHERWECIQDAAGQLVPPTDARNNYDRNGCRLCRPSRRACARVAPRLVVSFEQKAKTPDQWQREILDDAGNLLAIELIEYDELSLVSGYFCRSLGEKVSRNHRFRDHLGVIVSLKSIREECANRWDHLTSSWSMKMPEVLKALQASNSPHLSRVDEMLAFLDVPLDRLTPTSGRIREPPHVEAWNEHMRADPTLVVTLWHGTRGLDEARYIAKNGLRPGRLHGLAFGPGIYLGLRPKAEGFAHSRVLFEADVVLGRKKTAENVGEKWQGFDSLYYEGFKNPEWVVRDPTRVLLRRVIILPPRDLVGDYTSLIANPWRGPRVFPKNKD